jgi:hypothetical protein
MLSTFCADRAAQVHDTLRFAFIQRRPKVIVGVSVPSTTVFADFHACLEYINASIDYVIANDAIDAGAGSDGQEERDDFVWKDFIVSIVLNGVSKEFLGSVESRLGLYSASLCGADDKDFLSDSGNPSAAYAFEKTVVLPSVALPKSRNPLQVS